VENTGREFILEITGESGLYIKELIHGDDSRTQPNLSNELGIGCSVLELDVIKIHDEHEESIRSD
jgi:tRNA pseudouridine synthase 10